MTSAFAAAFLLASAAWSGPPPAGVVAVRIDWEGPSGCGDAGAFLAGIVARTGRVRAAEGGEDAVRIEVHLARSGGKVQGSLRLPVAENGKTELRKVDGASCDEVADALSFTAALALGASGRRADPAPVARSSSVTATPVGASQAGASRSGPSTPSGASPPGPTTSPAVAGTPPAQPPSIASSSPAGPTPEASAAPGPPRAAGMPPAGPPASSAPLREDVPGAAVSRTRALVLTIQLGAVAADVVSPFMSLGGAVSARLAWSRGASLDPSLGISVLHLRDDLLGASPDVAVHWTAVSLEACPGWGLGGAAASLELCVTGAGGWLSAAEQAVTVPRSAARSWWGAGPSLRGRLALGWGGLALEVDAVAQVPLVRRRFVTSTPEATVGETPAVGATLGVGVSRNL